MLVLSCSLSIACGPSDDVAEPQAEEPGSFRLEVVNARVEYQECPDGCIETTPDPYTWLDLLVDVDNLADRSMTRASLRSFDMEGVWSLPMSTEEPLEAETTLPLPAGGSAQLHFRVGEAGTFFDCSDHRNQTYVSELVFEIHDDDVSVTADTRVICMGAI